MNEHLLKILSVLMFFFAGSFLFSNVQNDQKYGKPSVDGPPEISQFLYCRGEWRVTVLMRVKDGAMKELKPASYVKCYYLPDGLTFQQQFSVEKMFFSTQVKAYNIKRKKWINKFINSKRQRWVTTTSQWINGEMITIVPRGYSGKESYISKEVDKEITDNRFVKYVYNSYDQGKTWGKPRFILKFNRINK